MISHKLQMQSKHELLEEEKDKVSLYNVCTQYLSIGGEGGGGGDAQCLLKLKIADHVAPTMQNPDCVHIQSMGAKISFMLMFIAKLNLREVETGS